MTENRSLSAPAADSSAVCPKVRFPPIQETLTYLLKTVTETNRQDLKHIPYQESILAVGGIDDSIKLLTRAIHPAVKHFENKEVTTKMLHEVREKQAATEVWEKDNGYLSFVTDDRNAAYWRGYVGQSENPRNRIMQHLRAIINSEQSTLHYYIVAKGAGHRAINFMKLWTLVWPDHVNKHIPMVFANILEMFMARCFQTLAPGILEEYFGKGEYSGTGLNVVPPLLQGVSLSPGARYTYSLQLEDSPDREIRWPQYRLKRRLEDQALSQERTGNSLKRHEYLEILTSAARAQLGISDLQPMDTTASLMKPFDMESCLRTVKDAVREPQKVVKPRGTLKARVGIILDQHSYLRESQPLSYGATGECAVSWGITESGFCEENSLIWPFTFTQEIIQLSTSLSFKQMRPDEADAISKANKDLIQASNLRIIIFSDAEVTRLLGLGRQISLNFRGTNVQAYVEIDEACIKRVFIHAPRPLSILWANAGRQVVQWCEIFRFGAVVAEFKSTMHTTFYERTLPMATADSIDAGIRAWLYRKGFRTSAALERLKAVGGSFPKSIFLLWTSLPERPKDIAMPTTKILIKKKTRNRSRVFPPEKLQEMRDLYDEMQQEWPKDAQTISADPSGSIEYDTCSKSNKSLESSRVSGSSESLEHHENSESDDESDTSSTLDIEAISQAMVAGERDDLEETGLTLCSSRSGKAQIKVSEVSECVGATTRKQIIAAQHDPAYGELTSIEIQTQISLLNGRRFKGQHWWSSHGAKEKRQIYGLCLLVHSVIWLRLRGFYLSHNKDGVIVQAELARLGERHPNAYVVSERADDPASCLAFRVTLKDENGDQKVVYPTSPPTLEAIFKVNSLVDWLHGATFSTLKTRGRRHIFINPTNVNVAEDLKFFQGGAYILEDGSRCKKRPSTAGKRPRADSDESESEPEPEPEQARGKKAAI
ncbi:hypothetical protein CNMCM7927_005255 [Aspergillus lentulus]|nr:hypothetical protein CNMCM7927_005255 [Aspergillus lentulus]